MPQTTNRLANLSATKLALLAKQAYAQVEDVLHAEPIAIVGMGCRFPGGADNPQAYWDLLRNGVDAVREVPADRWDADAYYAEDFSAPGKMNTRRGGYLERVDGFDAAFFGISPREAERMDPQQRLLLEVAYEALEDAGLTQRRLAGSQTGVFIASYHNDYTVRQYSDPQSINLRTLTGTLHSIAANRISYLLDLHGPSLALDTACSSSLVAVHLACQSLRSRESDMALAGGVSLMIAPELNIALAKVGFMSPDGTCYTFDSRAGGFGRGEGCGVIVLKRLADALVDGDRVLAVIRGSAVNQDGRSTVLTAPNGRAQVAVVRAALARAGVLPQQVSHIEAHGTGTLLGDPIEVEALVEALDSAGDSAGERAAGDAPRCALTSVKTNFGHLEAAAGIAGLIKVVLSMQHETIPPHLHLAELNPHLAIGGTRLFIPTELTPWPASGAAGGAPRIAGVSSFGIGGTNAHVVLADAPAQAAQAAPAQAEAVQAGACVLPISAASPEALAALADRYRDLLGQPGASVYDLCAAASLQRNHYAYRLAAAGSTPAEVSERLAAKQRAMSPQHASAAGRDAAPPPVAFVFSGQGPQWYAMGRELLVQEPVFRAVVERCDALLRPYTGWSLLEELGADEGASRLDQTEVAQPAIFALQMGLDALWRSWGIVPAAVIGHSVGEIAAACSAGSLTVEQAIFLVYHRARLMQRATGNGRMASVELPAQAVAQRIAPYGDRLSPAAANGPSTTVIAGEPAALQEVLAQLAQEGVSSRELRVNYAFHSAQMAPLAAELVTVLGSFTPQAGSIPIYSTVTGQASDGRDLDAAYWGRNMRQTVRFADAVRSAAQDGLTLFVEISPHPVLAGAAGECLAAAGLAGAALASLRRQRPERESLLATLADLYMAGCDPDWEALYPTPAAHVTLPLYPWQRERYWFEPTGAQAGQAGTPPTLGVGALRQGLLGPPLRSPAIEGVLFQSTIAADSPPFLGDHRIFGYAVLPATAYLTLALEAAAALPNGEASSHEVANVEIHAALALPEDRRRSLQVHVREGGDGSADHSAAAFQVFSSADEREWTLHAAGELRAAAEQSAPAAEPLTALRARMPEEIDGEAYYAGLLARGLDFGPAFRGLRTVRRRDGEALALIEPPADLLAGALHPALLDAALQALTAALPPTLAAAVYLPVGVGSLRVLRAPAGCFWSHLRLPQIGDAPQGETLTCDVTLFDEAGVLATVAGLRLLRTSEAALRRLVGRGGAEDITRWFQTVRWEALPGGQVGTLPTGAAGAAQSGEWLIFVGEDAAGAALAQRLRGAGLRAHVVKAGGAFAAPNAGAGADEAIWTVAAQEAGDYRRLLHDALGEGADARPLAGVLYLWGLDLPSAGDGDLLAAQERSLGGALHLAQALAAGGQAVGGLWLVTRGSQTQAGALTGSAPAVEQSTLWGLAATLALELPDLHPRCVDLDPSSTPAEDAADLWAEINAADGEQQVLRRGGERRGMRLHPFTPVSEPVGELPAAVELAQASRGLLDNLTVAPAVRRAPGRGEVEIRVRAAGLNFRDVLKALDQYPWDLGPLGDECAGEVAALGEGVTGLEVGQRVLAIAPGAFRSYVVAQAPLVAPLPEGMSFAEGASIPIAFVTAAYTLRHLGKLRAGERVLIHAAAGGVGLAAVQMAQMVGAEVIATAGSESKRAYLRSLGVRHVFDSRSLSFAEGVREVTGGRGVDVALNSLAGPFIPATLALLAAGGRFLEIGKSGLLTPEQAAALGEGRQYHTVFLGDQFVQEPQMVRALLADLLAAFADGSLRPLPLRSFALADAPAAFRFMAQARHTGKIVLLPPARMGEDVGLSPDLRRVGEGVGLSPGLRGVGEGVGLSPDLRGADATYLITGGLGGIGQVIARDLAAWGARNLVLVSRSGAAATGAAELCAELEAAGVRVWVAAGDVADYQQAAALIAAIQDRSGESNGAPWPPLRGVIHAAGVVDDGSLLQQNWKRFAGVLAPKVQGAWNLHLLTQQAPLDFFVCFSSLAGLQGAKGQSSYAAANRFLDALAHLRRSQGLPALTLDWGAWGEVGMAARLAAAHGADGGDYTRWTQQGMGIISPLQGAAALRLALRQPPSLAQLVIAPARSTARGRAGGKAGEQGAAPSGGAAAAGGQGQPELVTRWAATPPSLRRSLLIDYVRQGAIRTIGLRGDTQIDPGQPLHDLGLDSLMAVELRNLLGAACGVTLPATLLFDYPTAEAVANYLQANVPALAALEQAAAQEAGEQAGVKPPQSAAPQPTSAAEVAELSDEEAEALLLAELEQISRGR